MDIDEFLDRELSDLGALTYGNEKPEAIEPLLKEDLEPSTLFDNIKSNLIKGNLEEAEQSYVQLWHILLQQKLKWDKELFGQLYLMSRQFSSVLEQAYNEVKKKAERIYDLINRARAFLREGKKEMPFKLYSEIEEINNSIPNVFFEEKKIIQERITDFYKELRTTTDNELLKRVSALVQEVYRLIDKINISIRANDMINAIANYNKCIELYNQIPEGFLRHKNSAGIRILDIYKSLSISTEISNLQKQLNNYAQSKPQAAPAYTIQAGQAAGQQANVPTKSMMLSAKKERAKRNIEKGFYNEASRDIQEALQLEPNDAEARAINAKIKTLQ